MSTKIVSHTPGPWEPGRPDMATLVDGVESKWIYAGDKCVAIASGMDVEDWEEVMANARLIAKAPALLSALKDARKDTCSLHCPSVKKTGNPWTHSAKCDAYTELIATAEGRLNGGSDVTA